MTDVPYSIQGGGAGGPGDIPPVHVQLGDDEEDGEQDDDDDDDDEEVGEAGEGVPHVPGDEGAQGDREGGSGGGDGGAGGGAEGDEMGVVVGGANGEVVGAQVQHLGPADDAERMSSSSPSSLFRYMSMCSCWL